MYDVFEVRDKNDGVAHLNVFRPALAAQNSDVISVDVELLLLAAATWPTNKAYLLPGHWLANGLAP